MMIMGDTCTRACAFCNVKTGCPARWMPKNPPMSPAPCKTWAWPCGDHVGGPRRLADGGAEHFAQVINAIHSESPAPRWKF
jgi:lipoic acid synthetase